MRKLPLLVALSMATLALATVPTAEAGPCLVGDVSCAAHVQVIVCVTEPCETVKVCAGFGAVCATLD